MEVLCVLQRQAAVVKHAGGWRRDVLRGRARRGGGAAVRRLPARSRRHVCPLQKKTVRINRTAAAAQQSRPLLPPVLSFVDRERWGSGACVSRARDRAPQ